MRKIFLFILISVQLSAVSQVKIPLTSDMAYINQFFRDDVNYLLDSNISTRFTVYSPQYVPYRITFDLGDFDDCIPTQLKYYVNDGNTFDVRYYYERKSDGQKILFFTYHGGGWIQSWITVNIPSPAVASKFIIESNGADNFPHDIQLWGTYTLHDWGNITVPRSQLKNQFGMVVKPWDIDFTRYILESKPVYDSLGYSRVRLYNDYELNHDESNNWTENDWKQIDNGKILRADGKKIQMDYLSTPYQPFDTGSARTDPNTYRQLGEDIYHFGINNIAEGRYFDDIEVLNEPNAWYSFNYVFDYMDGYALACMMSVCYDGHKGLFDSCGMRAADTTVLVSLGGLASAEPDIWYEIMDWTIQNRGYKANGEIDWPFDVFSYHNYSSLQGQRQANYPGGVPPEIGMNPFGERMNTFRKHFAKDIKIRIGEYGWDRHYNSILNAPAFGRFSAGQTSAMWVARAMFGMAQNEIDASSYFRIQQNYYIGGLGNINDSNEVQFETMALLRREYDGSVLPNGQTTGIGLHRTIEGDYMAQLSEFGDYTFDATIRDDSIHILRLKKDTNYIYAIWSHETYVLNASNRPIFTERTGLVNLDIPTGTYKVRNFMDDGSWRMSTASLTSNGTVSVSYSSKPVLITTSVPKKRGILF